MYAGFHGALQTIVWNELFLCLFQQRHVQRAEQHEDADGHDDGGDGGAEERAEDLLHDVAEGHGLGDDVRALEGQGEVRLAHAAEHQAQDDGCGVEMHVLDDDAEDTGDDHDLDADEAPSE